MIRVQELSELYNAYAGIYDKKNLSEEEGALTTCKDGKKRVNCAAADAIYDKKQKENKGTVTTYKDGKPESTKEIDVNTKSNSEVDKKGAKGKKVDKEAPKSKKSSKVSSGSISMYLAEIVKWENIWDKVIYIKKLKKNL